MRGVKIAPAGMQIPIDTSRCATAAAAAAQLAVRLARRVQAQMRERRRPALHRTHSPARATQQKPTMRRRMRRHPFCSLLRRTLRHSARRISASDKSASADPALTRAAAPARAAARSKSCDARSRPAPGGRQQRARAAGAVSSARARRKDRPDALGASAAAAARQQAPTAATRHRPARLPAQPRGRRAARSDRGCG